MALALPLGGPFLRGVAATLGLVVFDEEAAVGIGFCGEAGVVSFAGAGALMFDFCWYCC